MMTTLIRTPELNCNLSLGGSSYIQRWVYFARIMDEILKNICRQKPEQRDWRDGQSCPGFPQREKLIQFNFKLI